MPRLKPILLLNLLALGVIAGFCCWAVRLPVPDAAAQTAPNPGEGIRSVAGGVTLALPVDAGQAGRPQPLPAASGATDSAGKEPGPGVQPLSASQGTAEKSPAPGAAWLARTAARTGIPSRALQAYAEATSRTNAATPGCGIGWNTVAAIGLVESGHGTHGGGSLTDTGNSSQPIIGPSLNGEGFAPIPDTDGGALDGDTTWDHAVGPMQFIPSTWQSAGRDGNGDGVADPLNIDDAALSAAAYLCAEGRDLLSGEDWTNAVLSYNHSEAYVSQVRDQANAYSALAAAG
ncbi:lytic murein transglycosylase [Arthrobacter sp. NPDC056493]|uniref:lytic transglycosylase domain-containing protein n=1 Tax=Arthrobacter sp. NPDC056493 TaxID=3345839 RepID=UPI00366B7522